MNIVELLAAVPPGVVYALVGGLVGVESMGVPVPGETAIVAAAAMATHDELDVSPWGVGIAAAAGAIIGDSIGYAVGRRFGEGLVARLGRRFPKHLSQAHIAYIEHLFARFGMVTVFFGRFVALLRMFAGPIAGALKMPYQRFLVANATGGIVWVGLIVGTIFGFGTVAHHFFSRSAWILLAVLVIAGLVSSKLIDAEFQRRVTAYSHRRGVVT